MKKYMLWILMIGINAYADDASDAERLAQLEKEINDVGKVQKSVLSDAELQELLAKNDLIKASEKNVLLENVGEKDLAALLKEENKPSEFVKLLDNKGVEKEILENSALKAAENAGQGVEKEILENSALKAAENAGQGVEKEILENSALKAAENAGQVVEKEILGNNVLKGRENLGQKIRSKGQKVFESIGDKTASLKKKVGSVGEKVGSVGQKVGSFGKKIGRFLK